MTSNRWTLVGWMLLSTIILGGCGGGGGGGGGGGESAPPSSNGGGKIVPETAVVDIPSVNRSTVTIDEYGLQQPSILYSSVTPEYLRLTTAVPGSEINGWELSSVMTIYVSEPKAIQTGVTYSFDEGVGTPFPGLFFFSNGASSTTQKAVSGTLIFTSWGTAASSLIEGHYDILMEDQSPIRPQKPVYRIAGNFTYFLGSRTTIVPSPAPIPEAAYALFQRRCEGCHWVSTKEAVYSKEGPVLADRGYEAEIIFSQTKAHHDAVLTAEELFLLKSLINAN